MDLRHLRTFVSVVDNGTVSKAALRLRTAQPALSRQIGELEAELGVKLFDRIRRRLVLTAEGERLLADCRGILGGVQALNERVKLMRSPDSGVLKVGLTAQMIDGVFAQFLHIYARRRPKVQVQLVEAVGPALLAMLERGEVHVCIAGIRAIQANDHPFAIFPLPPVEFLAACHPSLRLGSGESIDIGKLKEHPLLLLDTSFFFRKTFDASCRLAGLTPNIFIESHTSHALLALAEAGHGVAIVPSILPTHRYRLRIVRLTHRGRSLREPFAILWDKRRTVPAYVADFCDALAGYMRDILPISRPRVPKSARSRRLEPRG